MPPSSPKAAPRPPATPPSSLPRKPHPPRRAARLALLAIVLVALAATSCRSAPSPAGDDADQIHEQPGEEAARVRRPDPGPHETWGPGERRFERAEPRAIEATTVFSDEGHLYVVAEYETAAMTYVQSTHVGGARHGVAVNEHDADAGVDRLYVRLVGAALPDEPLVVRLVTAGLPIGPFEHAVLVETVHELRISGMAAAERDARIADGFKAAVARYYQERVRNGRFGGFEHFVSSRFDTLRSSEREPEFHAGRGSAAEAMALFSGYRSIEEALQLDRALMVRGTPARERTVPLEEVEPIALPEHPWDAMLGELGNPDPALEPLARVVPADMLYLHFDDLRTFVRLADELTARFAPVVQTVELRAGSRHVVERYETELAIERSGLSEHLGHLAARSVALVTSDPFVRDGTDVSIVFHVRDRTVLNAALERYEQKTRERFPELARHTLDVGGHRGQLLATPDGQVRQHRLELGEGDRAVLIVSNSARALEKFVAVHEGRAPSLAASGDFRYMRARYPHGDDAEDGFLFIGDAFVANAISPRTRILAARRQFARADLALVNHSALLYGWLEGVRPDGLAALVEAELVRPGELEHADGEAIAFSPDRGAHSSWGSLAALTPLIERSIENVTPDEQRAYEWFRSQYLGLWQNFVDPIAARIAYRDGTFALDGRMLPLVENSDYRNLRRQVGTCVVTPPVVEGAVQWTLAVGEDASLRRELNMLARQLSGRGDLGLDWLGDWVMAGLGDRSGLWDLALLARVVPHSRAGDASDMDAALPALSRLPLYLGAHVKNSMTLAATLTALRSVADSAAPGMVVWAETEPYRDVRITTITPAQAGADDPLRNLAVHYGLAGDVFVVSLERATLKQVIDDALDGRLSAAVSPDGAAVSPDEAEGAPAKPVRAEAMQSMLTLAPVQGQTSWLVRTALGWLERNVGYTFERAYEAQTALVHGLPGTTQAERERLAVHYLGFEPADGHSGTWSVDDELGRVRHSLYGPGTAQLYPTVPIEGTPLTRALEELEGLDLHLSFDGEGNHAGLRTRINLQHAK